MGETTTVFMDESGYTGEDLLNPSQPTFVLATICIEEPEAIDLKARFFGAVKSAELKHTDLRQRDSQRAMVIEFIKYLVEESPLGLVYIADKRFALVCKLVDVLVETTMHARGVDLYERGANIALSNVLHASLPFFQGEEMLLRFQKLVREQSPNAYAEFFGFLMAEKSRVTAPQLRHMIGMVYEFSAVFRLDGLSHIRAAELTFGVSAALILMSTWQGHLNRDLRLVHDRSSEMRHAKEVWDKLVNPRVAPIIVGYDRRKQKFPIRVLDTRFEDSKNHVGLQLADVLAGAMSYWATGKDDEYRARLREAVQPVLICGGLIASTDVTPRELGTEGANAEEPIQHTQELLKPRPK